MSHRLACPSVRVRGRQLVLRFLIITILLIVIFFWSQLCSLVDSHNDNDVVHTKSSAHHHHSQGQLLDLNDFQILINCDICGNDEIFMLIFIHSAPSHLGHRNVIRSTWGFPGLDMPIIKTVFMLAKPSNESQQAALMKESDDHHDIVQGNFIDSYRNLTYKHAMGLQWAAYRCPQATFVMKMDDDIFVDIYQLINLLKNQFRNMGRHIACYFQNQMPVVRDPVSKWFVSKDEFSNDTFEDYCSGWAYIINPKTAKELFDVASQVPYFWVDDVHITGTVAKKAGIVRFRINRYFALETDGLVQWTRSGSKLLWNKIFAPTWGDLKLMEIAHKNAYNCYEENCICCYAPPTKKPTPSATRQPLTGKSLVKLLNLRP